MKRYRDLVADLLAQVQELMPWDLAEWMERDRRLLVVDVREADEFAAMHIPGSINAPRGTLEAAAEWEYEETIPELAASRERPVVVVCRSGNRSVLAAHTLQMMGFQDVASLKLGVRGWKDDDQPLVDAAGEVVDPEAGDHFFTARLRPEQYAPKPSNVCTLPRPRCCSGGARPVQEAAVVDFPSCGSCCAGA